MRWEGRCVGSWSWISGGGCARWGCRISPARRSVVSRTSSRCPREGIDRREPPTEAASGRCGRQRWGLGGCRQGPGVWGREAWSPLPSRIAQHHPLQGHGSEIDRAIEGVRSSDPKRSRSGGEGRRREEDALLRQKKKEIINYYMPLDYIEKYFCQQEPGTTFAFYSIL